MACVFVGLCVFVCVCIREAAADRRALGDYGTGRGTITHRRPHRRPQTDSQAGLNADGSLIGICHQEPTKSIYLHGGRRGEGCGVGGKGIASFSHSNRHARAQDTLASYSAHFFFFSFFYSTYDSSYSYRAGADHLFFPLPLKNMSPKGQRRLSAFFSNTAALTLQTDHRVGDDAYYEGLILTCRKSGHHCN